MDIEVKETILKTNNISNNKKFNGVTYFKLKSGIPGDYTKNCGLLGEEIDGNFFFLRGYDIESIGIDENRNLIINRVNKDFEPLTVNIGEELGQPTFLFEKEKGRIVVTYPDGSTSLMEGFLIEGKDIRIATDSTLDGDGTLYNPMRIADIETTGTFAPVDEYLDLTDGSKMKDIKTKGYRIVSKEKIDNFGRLYTVDDIATIQNKLEESGSQWRIPSKEDWDELLNALECDEYKNHSAYTSSWLGEKAGSALKSKNIWNNSEMLPNDASPKGEDIFGLTIYPLGIGPERNAIINDENYDVEGFGQIAGMWTTSKNEEGETYVKIFGYNSAKVGQDTYGKGARMSIRLCKDYSYSNFNDIEVILGLPYPTELIFINNDNTVYSKIWTKINVYFEGNKLNGITSDEWSAATNSDKGVNEIYFINEWDGSEWHKRPIQEGESIVILNYSSSERKVSNHEWRLVNGKLIDTVELFMSEFDKKLDAIDEKFIAEHNDRIASDEEIDNKVDKYYSELNTTDKKHNKEIGLLNEKINNAIDDLSDKIKKEIEIRYIADTNLQKNIDEEIKERRDSDIIINNTINTEIEDRISEDNILRDTIFRETANIKSDINDESNRAILAEGNIINDLTNEINRATLTETQLSGSINDLKSELVSYNINSKDLFVEKTEKGTNITIQVDNKTITKVADAQGIYDTKVAILGTLLSVKKVTPTSPSIKSRYELQGADGKLIGDAIELPVESALVDVRQGKLGASVDPITGNYIEGIGDITMDFIYRLEDGNYKLVQIIVSEYFTDSHFGRGLNNQDGTISLLEGDGNEYLVIGEDTIAVIGVKTDIETAKNIAIETAETIAKDYTNMESQRAIAAEKDINIRIDKEIIDRIASDEETIEKTKVIVTEEIAKIVANAPENFDTLKEIADWIQNDTTGAASMANDILNLKTKVETLEKEKVELETKVENLQNSIINLENNVKEIIKDYLMGVENEISIKSNDDNNKLLIGFSESAIFGSITEN